MEQHMSLIGLTEPEIRQLTGFVYKGKQINALVAMGIQFRVRPDGSPFVARSTIDTVQSQEETRKPLIFNSLSK